MDELEKLKIIIDSSDSGGLVDTLSRGALKLEDDHINTVQFAFWLSYMAETDLNDVIKEAWEMATKNADPSLIEVTKKVLQEGIRGEKELDPENLKYFSDKIKLYESFYGKDNRTKLFWKLNDIRNALSHNRLDKLTYNENNISDISVRRQLLKDYFETAMEDKDWTQSDFYKSLTPEERELIE